MTGWFSKPAEESAGLADQLARGRHQPGKCAPGDVLALETLRRGLRADTIHLFTRARAEASGEIGAGR